MSVFALLLTAGGRALAELSGAEDFCAGVPMSTRRPEQVDEVGCELNVLPVRLRELAAPGAEARVWDTLVDAALHADLPLQEIIACRPPVDGRRMPVYQALVAFQNWPRTVHHAGPARLRALPVSACGPQGEVLVEFYDLAPTELAGVVQAPSAGPWAGRLRELAGAVGRQLTRAARGGDDARA
jgi:non-ribosomal peptide synthetase component F